MPDNLISANLEVVRKLLEGGADPNAFMGDDAVDVRPLAVQCFMGRLEAVRLLLKYGADANFGRQSTAETPLHHATAQDDRADCIRLLLEAGAKVNCKANVGVPSINFNGMPPTRGETPLHRAAAYCNEHIVQILLDAGADKSLTDAKGDRPYDWAVQATREDSILNLLR